MTESSIRFSSYIYINIDSKLFLLCKSVLHIYKKCIIIVLELGLKLLPASKFIFKRFKIYRNVKNR